MTIVGDAKTGRVLSVARDKGAAALRQFTWSLKNHKGHRFVFMRTEENLDAKGRHILD